MLVLSALAGACTSADEEKPDSTGDSVPPEETAPVDTAAAFCANAPELGWANFGEGFLGEHCQPCHATAAPDRHGAPESAYFDTVEDAWARAPAILALATGESPTMPPEGGVTPDDRRRLAWWLRCGTPGT